MATGYSTWPTNPDAFAVDLPRDNDPVFGGNGIQSAGQYFRNVQAAINALQSDIGPTNLTPRDSLRGRIAALELTITEPSPFWPPSLLWTLTDAGSVGNGRPAQVVLRCTDGMGNVLDYPFTVTVALADAANPYGPAINGTIAPGTDPTSGLSPTVLKVVTTGKNLVLQADANGFLTLNVTSSIPGDTLALLCGDALGSPALDYSNTFSIETAL